MAKLYLVRHGQAVSGWGLEKDPGLSDLGRAQANAAAQALAPLGPLPIITSPRTRTRETSRPLAEIWQTEAAIEPGVGEIRFPLETAADRVHWLAEIMDDRWSNLDGDLLHWRREVIQTLVAIDADAIVFTHYIAINVAVGHATGDDRVVCFRPDNCSITVLENSKDSLRLLELGAQAVTKVR